MATSAPRPLLVAVGDSDVHQAALVYASDQAVKEGRAIRLVHVVPRRTGGGGPESMLLGFEAVHLVGEQLVHHAAELVEKLVEGQVKVEALTLTGSPVDVLVELGQDAERIVLQHRQQARLMRVFTGSVAAGVAGRSVVPVVSVPEYWTGPLPTGAHITVGVSGPDTDEAVVVRALETARLVRGGLTALHAWYLPTAYDDAVVDRSAGRLWTAHVRDLLAAHVEPLRTAYPDVEVRLEVVHMRPADALLRAAGHSHLLVVGRSRSPHHLPHLGSTTRALIRESTCPVEVVPAPLSPAGTA